MICNKLPYFCASSAKLSAFPVIIDLVKAQRQPESVRVKHSRGPPPSFAQHQEKARWNVAGRIVEKRLLVPNSPREEMRPEIGREQRGVSGDRGSGATAIRVKLRTEGPT